MYENFLSTYPDKKSCHTSTTLQTSIARFVSDSWASCQYGVWSSYTLQCGTIMTLISPGDCTLQCRMWLWNRDREFTKWHHPAMWYVAQGWHAVKFARWQHPAMWQVAVGWHAIEFAQTSAILELYIWFRFRPHHRSRHVILHQSPKFYPNRTTLGRKKWRHVDFQDGWSQPSWILGVQ